MTIIHNPSCHCRCDFFLTAILGKSATHWGKSAGSWKALTRNSTSHSKPLTIDIFIEKTIAVFKWTFGNVDGQWILPLVVEATSIRKRRNKQRSLILCTPDRHSSWPWIGRRQLPWRVRWWPRVRDAFYWKEAWFWVLRFRGFLFGGKDTCDNILFLYYWWDGNDTSLACRGLFICLTAQVGTHLSYTSICKRWGSDTAWICDGALHALQRYTYSSSYVRVEKSSQWYFIVHHDIMFGKPSTRLYAHQFSCSPQEDGICGCKSALTLWQRLV